MRMANYPTVAGAQPSASGTTEALARGLGFFSLGLGLIEVLASRDLARWLGMRGSEKLLAGYGVREMAAGIGILSSQNRAPWLWARVAGDALDLGTLAMGLGRNNRRRVNVVTAVLAVAGVTALDVLCAQALSVQPARAPGATRDYSGRRGMPRPAEAMRGAARDFEAPRDMRIPEAMRPYKTG
jgi:hypothetical protein